MPTGTHQSVMSSTAFEPGLSRSSGDATSYADRPFSPFGLQAPPTLREPPLRTVQPALFGSAYQPLPVPLERALGDLKRLGAGWDDEEAHPIHPRALMATRTLLSAMLSAQISLREPVLVPTADGAVQVEWHEKDRSLEFDFLDSEWVALGVELDARGRTISRFSGTFTSEDTLTPAGCYAWFVRREPRRAPWPFR